MQRHALFPDARQLHGLGARQPAQPSADPAQHRAAAGCAATSGIAVLEGGFAAAGYRATVVGARLTPEQRRELAHPRLHISDVLLDMDAVSCNCAIMTNGHSTLHAALLDGKALLLLPPNIEQRMLATRVHDTGIGLSVSARMPEVIRQKFARLMQQVSFTRAAQAFAERYAGLAVGKNPERLAALAEKLLGS